MQISDPHRKRIGWRHPEDGLREPAHLNHGPAVLVIGLGIEPRMPRDLTERARVVVHAPEVITAGHRRERAIERQNLEAVAREIEVADDLGPEQGDDVRADGEFESRKDLFGDRGAADEVPAFEDEHFSAGARQICGGGEAVVARADHDRVVGR